MIGKGDTKMGISHWFVGMVGLFGGIVIASGLVALLIGLNIIPRYAGITHTAHHMLLYENCAMAGAIVGNLFTLYEWKLPFGRLVFSLGGNRQPQTALSGTPLSR